MDTPKLHQCLIVDDCGGVHALLQRGMSVDSQDAITGNTPLMDAAQYGAVRCVELLLSAGADRTIRNQYDEAAISLAANLDIVRLLVEAGDDIGDVNDEMRRALTGLGGDEKLNVSSEDYRAQRLRRFGRSNPEPMDLPFWREMVRTGVTAYRAKAQFGDESDYSHAVWCFHRFGTSFTALPDGRFVQVAGEHEDFYDPDFCIYNDVIVHDGPSSFRLFGYPEDVFPPTDFHTATLVGQDIYLIGSLGYQGSRVFGTTPVFRLSCDTWQITPVLTHGDNPGWIYTHRAKLIQPSTIQITGGEVCQWIDGKEEHVANRHAFQLDLRELRWSRATASQVSSRGNGVGG
jgi:hypothetical protein